MLLPQIPAPPPPQIPAPPPSGPSSLDDLKRGRTVDGDSGADPSQAPAWLDLARYERGRAFFQAHSFQLLLAWHVSITIGFSLPNLLQALVFTKASDTPQKSLERYLRTFKFLAEWHLGDVFDATSPSVAYTSVQQVRSIHLGVRTAMEKADPTSKWLTQYDMGLVQSGFMGAISTRPAGFGLHGRTLAADIEDYTYFWRCVAYQLGVRDDFNLCGRGGTSTDNVVQEIIDDVLLPSSVHPPEPAFDSIAGAYIAGLNLAACNIPIASVRSVIAFAYHTLGRSLPGPRLSVGDQVRLGIMKLLVALLRWAPCFSLLANSLCLCVARHLANSGTCGANSNDNNSNKQGPAAGGQGVCPYYVALAAEPAGTRPPQSITAASSGAVCPGQRALRQQRNQKGKRQRRTVMLVAVAAALMVAAAIFWVVVGIFVLLGGIYGLWLASGLIATSFTSWCA